MASLAAVNSFSGLNVQSLKVSSGVRASTRSRAATVVCSAGIPWQKVGKALVATSAGILIAASSANAAKIVKLGGDGGTLVFVPDELTVASGEVISFENNAGFPHNVVFDEDGVPKGVKVGDISREPYLNAKGEKFEVTLTTPGVYEAYCEPHQGAGMAITITVK